jgi:DUF438 domain-containing protein
VEKERRQKDKDMNIPNTNITLEEVLDQMPLNIQFVDNNGFVRYLNKAAAARPAKGKREVGVNIQNCHARPESLETKFIGTLTYSHPVKYPEPERTFY